MPHTKKPKEPTSFYSRVAGVSYKNDDGSDRQRILSRCKDGEILALAHVPIAEDENAIRVYDMAGNQLGYLTAMVAEEIAPLLDEGINVTCEISEITGGTRNKPSLGCNIIITKYAEEPGPAVTIKTKSGCLAVFIVLPLVGTFPYLVATISAP